MAKRPYSLFELFAIISIADWLFSSKKVIYKSSKSSKGNGKGGCCGCLVIFLIIAGIGALISPSSSSSPKQQQTMEQQQTVKTRTVRQEVSKEGNASVVEQTFPSPPVVLPTDFDSKIPSLRIHIMEEREEFKKLIANEAQSQNKAPIWSEDLLFKANLTSLCGLDLGKDITSYFQKSSFQFKTETFRHFADGLLSIEFESPVNSLDSKVKNVIIDENLMIHGVCVSWPMKSQSKNAYKFAEVRAKLTKPLNLPRTEVDPEAFLQYCSTYTHAMDDNRVIVLKTDDEGLELMLLATTKPLSIYDKNSQNDMKDNPIAQRFCEALKNRK